MKIIRNNFLPIVIFALLTGFYFFTRLFLLKNFPIFVDEATHIHWAQLGFYNPDNRLISLQDGKQPFFIWVIIFLMQWIKNPLVAGRAASILGGFGSSIGILFLTFEVYKKRFIALLSMFLYIICPFTLLIDRIAIYDSWVTFFAIWSLYLSILLVKRISLGNSLLLALSFGGGILNKSSGFLSIYLLPISLVLFKKEKQNGERFWKWVFYAALSVGLAYTYYGILMLSSYFPNVASKSGYFVNSPLTLLHDNFWPLFFHNSILFIQWIFLLFTPFYLLLVGIGFYKNVKKENIFLIINFLINLIGAALLVRIPFPRYIYFMTMLLLPIAALGCWELYQFLNKKLMLSIIVILFFCSFALYSDYKIMTNLEFAPIPSIEKDEFVTGWSAGGGMGDIIKFLLSQSQKQQITVITDGLYGSMSTEVMDMYFFENQQVNRMAFDTFTNTVPQDVINKAKIMPVYLFINQIQKPIPWKTKLILKKEKGHSKNFVSLYQLMY